MKGCGQEITQVCSCHTWCSDNWSGWTTEAWI